VSHLHLVTLVVREYDPAIQFFVDVLGFELVEDVPSTTNDGRPKRWVVVRPRGAQTGVLLARADGEQQVAIAGAQFAGRVGLFLRVDDFDAVHARLAAAGVEFLTQPRVEPDGRVAYSGISRATAGTCWARDLPYNELRRMVGAAAAAPLIGCQRGCEPVAAHARHGGERRAVVRKIPQA